MTSSFSPDLLQRCRAGDSEALDELVRLYAPELERLARAVLSAQDIDPRDVQDAVQEAFIAALGGLERFRGDSELRTWLFAITLNVCRKRLLRRRAGERLMGALRSLLRAHRVHEQPVERTVEWQLDLRTALASLDENHRLPVILRYGHGLSVAEIAGVMNLPVNTVLSRLFHARAKLRRLLEEPQ